MLTTVPLSRHDRVTSALCHVIEDKGYIPAENQVRVASGGTLLAVIVLITIILVILALVLVSLTRSAVGLALVQRVLTLNGVLAFFQVSLALPVITTGCGVILSVNSRYVSCGVMVLHVHNPIIFATKLFKARGSGGQCKNDLDKCKKDKDTIDTDKGKCEADKAKCQSDQAKCGGASPTCQADLDACKYVYLC